MSSNLTEEQKKKIEENRRIALERRAAKLAEAERLKKAASIAQAPIANNFVKQPNVTAGSPARLVNRVSIPGQPSNCSKPAGSPLSADNFYKKPDFSSQNNSSVPRLGFPGNNSLGNNQVPKVNSVPNNPKPTFNNVQPSKSAPEPPQRTWNVTTDALLGTVSLISKDRFVLDIGFNSKLIDICKTIPGRIYDAARKAWTFPLKEYDTFKKVTSPLSPQIVIGNLPPSIVKVFSNNWESTIDYKSIDISRVEPNLVDRLYPFQKEGIQFGISKSGRCLIADDMGLGKTIQALGIADYYRDEWPLLIVCPSSMRYQWDEEIRHNLPKVPSYSIYVLNNNKDVIERAKVVILSYDLMATKKDFLKSYGFGVIIVDECHSLKNIKTKRTKAAIDLIGKIRRVILLSGTPALSRPSELYTQIKAIQPALFKDMIEYGVRYCDGKQGKFGWDFNGSSHLDELKVVLEEKVMIRRLKTDVIDQLPKKTRQVMFIEADSNSKSMSAFEKKLSNDKINGVEKRSTLLAYFAETGKAKINSICKYVEELLNLDKKFLIFAHHKVVLDAICDTLERHQTYYIRIDGSVNSEERKSVSDQFQEEAEYKVAVLSLKAANTGITLTAASLVVFAELFWNPGELIQAEDRAHRIGQESNVLIQYLLSKQTADTFLWPLIQGKLNVLNQAGLTNSTALQVSETKYQNQGSQSQSVITDYFKEMEDDVDESDLADLLDEIEGVQEKKMKLS